jgi:hypothetical protein
MGRVSKGAKSQVPTAYTCNPSYSGSRSGVSLFKASPGQIVWKILSQKTQHKKVAQDVGPEFKPQYHKKKKKKKKPPRKLGPGGWSQHEDGAN